MKTTIALIGALIITSLSFAQVVEEDFVPLFDLYIFDKQDACLNKSLKMIDKEQYSRSPEPYLFASRVLIKKHQNADEHHLSVRYLKDALKYGSKYVKYKNKSDFPEKYDNLYLEDEDRLVVNGLKMAEYYYYEANIRKSTYYVRKVAKIESDNPKIQVLQGLAYLINRNHRQGYEILQAGLSELKDEDTEFPEHEGEVLFLYLKSYKKVAKAMNKTEEYYDILEQCSAFVPEKFDDELVAISAK